MMISIICIILSCINGALAICNLLMVMSAKNAKKYYEEVAAEYEAKLKKEKVK